MGYVEKRGKRTGPAGTGGWGPRIGPPGQNSP